MLEFNGKRPISTYRPEWGRPPGTALSDERAAWVLANVRKMPRAACSAETETFLRMVDRRIELDKRRPR
jgi:hypothetical protein